MISVRINGEDSKINSSGMSKINEIVELIKTTIDPDHMITAIKLDGRDLDDNDWTVNTSQFGTAILEVETGAPNDFVNARIKMAAEIVQACFFEFRDARKTFQSGSMTEGNQKLAKAVNTLRSFFAWYSTLLELVPADRRAQFEINDQVSAISEICKRICQQQLYQSWWALGETIAKELEPKLDGLEDHFRKVAAKI